MVTGYSVLGAAGFRLACTSSKLHATRFTPALLRVFCGWEAFWRQSEANGLLQAGKTLPVHSHSWCMHCLGSCGSTKVVRSMQV